MIRVVHYRWFWYFFSSLLAILSLAGFFFYGLRFGIDFTGGALLELTWEKERPSTAQLSSLFAAQKIQGVVVQPVGEKQVIARFPSISEEKHQKLLSEFDSLGAYTEDRFETIGPAIGKELQKKAWQSIVFIIIAITVYVAWAFRHVSRPVASWKYGVITIVALLHDVLLPIGVFAFLGAFLGVEVNSAFIVALLTVLGYSVNDTIVVFDRIRENLSRLGTTLSFDEIIDRSVTQTLARSLNTTLTTLLALIAVFFFGGETVRFFALALIIGIASGAYSSIFVASPLLASAYRLQRK